MATKTSKKNGVMLPQNMEAEQNALGCMLINKDVPIAIISEINAEDFYYDSHGIIFDAMKSLYLENKPIDIVTVNDYLTQKGLIDCVGGIEYLVTLSNGVVSEFNYKSYVDIIKRCSALRSLIKTCQDTISSAYNATDLQPLMDAEKAILKISEKDTPNTVVKIGDTVDDVLKDFEEIQRNKSKLKGITTGFYALDKMTNGLQKGDLILLAARPGFGKSSLAMNIVANAARAGYKSAVFTLEMPKNQITERLLCSLACVNMKKTKSGDMSAEEWQRIYSAVDLIRDYNIYIDDNSSNNPLKIEAICRRLKHESGLDLVMIDYLQLMSETGKEESRQQTISNFTRTLKIAAKELDVPIILLSQLNRAVESRTDHTPMLSDLRESGSIEQDADIVMFINRPDQYADTKNDTAKLVELVIAKHRNGEQGKIPLIWKGEYTTFISVDRDKEEESLSQTAPVNHAGMPHSKSRFNKNAESSSSAQLEEFDANVDDIF